MKTINDLRLHRSHKKLKKGGFPGFLHSKIWAGEVGLENILDKYKLMNKKKYKKKSGNKSFSHTLY